MKYYLNLERPHLMNPAMNVIIKADFRGQFYEDVFREAVKKLSDAYGILRATVQMDEKGLAYYKPSSAADVPVWLLEGGASFEQLVQRENKKIFHLKKESMLRIFVIPAPAAFSVIFVSHHLLGDGKSNLLLMEALGRAYKGEELPYVGIRLIKGTENFPRKSELSSVTKMYLGSLNRTWKKEKRIFSFEEYNKLFQTYHIEREPVLYSITLNAVELRKLTHRCKKIGVTVNSAVVAAFSYAEKEMDEHHKNSTDKIGIAVDVRDELNFDAARLVGNYASAVSIEQGKVGKEEFAKYMAMIHNKLQKKIKNTRSKWLCLQAFDWLEGTLIDAGYFYAYGRLESKGAKRYAKMINYAGEPSELGVTNLGKVFMRMPEGIEMESIEFVPPAAPCNDITVGIVTYQGVMHVSIMYEPTAVRRETVQKIGGRVKELLLREGE